MPISCTNFSMAWITLQINNYAMIDANYINF